MITKTLRILLVDDERPARKWLRELLAAHPEIEVMARPAMFLPP